MSSSESTPPVRVEVYRRRPDGTETVQQMTPDTLAAHLRATAAGRVRDERGRPLVATVLVWMTAFGDPPGDGTVLPAAATVADLAAQTRLPHP